MTSQNVGDQASVGHQHVFVISHRRSGTHLTIDSLRNNFPYYQEEYINLDRIDKTGHPESLTLSELKEKLQSAPRILKTHALPGWNMYASSPEVRAFIHRLYTISKKVYVCRNCFDVMVSLYEFRKTFDDELKEVSFKEFLYSPRTGGAGETRFEYWARHISGWLLSDKPTDFTCVRYEDLFLQYNDVIKGFADFLELEHPETIKDLRVRKPTSDSQEYSYSELEFTQGARKGIVGDYLNYFDEADLMKVSGIIEPVHGAIGYNLIHH